MKASKWWYTIEKINNRIFIRNEAEALAAASFSVVLSALTACGISRLYYGSWPHYSQFVAGGTVYNGYNKAGDMCIFYLLLFCLPIYFIFFLWAKHRNYEKQYHNKTETQEKNYVNKKKCLSYNSLNSGFDFVAMLLMGAFAVTAIETALSGRFVIYREQFANIRIFLIVCYLMWMVALLVWAWAKDQKVQNVIDKISVCAQLLLPFCFLGYFGFYYQYENETGLIELFYSRKWKWFCVCMFIIFFVAQIYRLQKKKTGISVYTLISIATMSVMRTPEGMMSVDFFHNGEMALPMQQLVSFGQIPYFDIDPIHGLCDYVYSFFNYLFFDGGYFSQNAGIVVANLFVAAFLSVVLANCLKSRSSAVVIIWILMPYLVDKAGVRYVMFIAAFLILLSDKARKSNLWFFWWWVLLRVICFFCFV